MSTFSSVVCCINLTEHNEEIVQYTRQMCEKDATIHLVHTMPSMSTLKNLAETEDGIFDQATANLQKELEEYKEKYFNDFPKVETHLIEGSTSAGILKLVDLCCAELIVMGSRSSKNWLSVFMDNPSNVIAQKTRVPVLLVPNDLSFECMPVE